MKSFTKFAVAGLLATLLAGCKTLPPEEKYGRIFTGKVLAVNNARGLAKSQEVIAKYHIDMSQHDLAGVTMEQGFTSYLIAGVIAPKSAHLQPGDFIEFQNGTQDRQYSLFTRIIQRASEKSPCKWEGSLWGRNTGIECK